jgi:hypothetical protein
MSDDGPKIAGTAQELFEDIIRSRGGVARFTPEQVRIAHALTSVLARKPSDIDPLLAARLAEMLPRPLPAAKEAVWVPEIEFHDGYSVQLQRAIDGSPDDVARTALTEAQHRIVSLESENEGLRTSLAQLRGAEVKEAIHSGTGHWDASQPDKRVSESRAIASEGNVVRMPIHGSKDSLTVNGGLLDRYPNLAFDEPTW